MEDYGGGSQKADLVLDILLVVFIVSSIGLGFLVAIKMTGIL